MHLSQRNQNIFHALESVIGHNYCALIYRTPFELLIATMLSAQCTDKRVNMTTPTLFAAYPSMQDMAEAPVEDIAGHIRSVTFPNNKAKHCKGTAQKILREYQGQVPDTMEALCTLPGVARKTANVVLIHGFGKAEGIPVDTHVLRVAHRLQLTSTPKNATLAERELTTLFPKTQWDRVSTYLIHHGRTICHARSPQCSACALQQWCPSTLL